MKCEICGFEAKNENGLRLHNKKHENKETPKVEITYPEFRVYDKRGNFVRAYTRKLHGDNFVQLGEGFILKNRHRGFNKGIILG